MSSYRSSHLGDHFGERYDAKHKVRVDALIWDNMVKPLVRAHLEDSVRRGARRYLDFACGTGRLLKVGQRVFGFSVGIDVSADMLAVARERVPEARLLQVDVTKTPADDIGQFDCATLFRFILNAEPELRREVLKWLSEHIVPGGTLIVNNHRNSASVNGLLARVAFWLPASARNFLSFNQAKEILSDAGFLVVRCDGFRVLPSVFGRPLLGRWLQLKGERLFRKLRLGRFGAELVIVARRA